MSSYNFDCPELLAKKFWATCVKNGDTPGHKLRQLMIETISERDPGFIYDAEKRPIVSIGVNSNDT